MVACLSGMGEGLIPFLGQKEGEKERGREGRRERGKGGEREKLPLVVILENSIRSRKALERPLSQNVRNMPSLTTKHTLPRILENTTSKNPESLSS